MPIGLFMFGWTSGPGVPWIVPTIAVGIATIGIFTIYLSVFNYLADTYHRYASSALAAQSFCRNILGMSTLRLSSKVFGSLLTRHVRRYFPTHYSANVQQARLWPREQLARRYWHAAYCRAVDTGFLWSENQGEK